MEQHQTLLKFADSHEWIKVEGDIGVVGISAHARKELGEIIFIQLPQIGAKLQLGEEAAVLESTKAAADIYAPVSGEVTEVNPDYQKINTSPEEEGWLFKIKISSPSELDNLLDREQYLISCDA